MLCHGLITSPACGWPPLLTTSAVQRPASGQNAKSNLCVPMRREQWLLPVLARLLPHMQQRLTASWQRQMSPVNGADANGMAGRSAAEADVVQVCGCFRDLAKG